MLYLGTRIAKGGPTTYTMKTSFTSLSLLLAAGFPVSLLAEIVGLPVPDAIDAGAFGLFVTVLSVLTFVSDYARPPRALTTATASPLATEERRLAA